MKTGYEVVLAAARKQCGQALTQALRSSSIDSLKQGEWFLTPAAQLASEGKFEEVKFLVSHGASLRNVAYGAALGGYYDTSNLLDSDDFKFEDWPYMRRLGAAQKGDFDYLDPIMENTDREESDAVALGAALGGHSNYIDGLLQRDDIQDLFPYIAKGAASVGDQGRVDSLKVYDSFPIYVDQMVVAAAAGGHFDLAERLASEYSVNNIYLAMGASLGGQFDYLQTLFEKGIDTQVFFEYIVKEVSDDVVGHVAKEEDINDIAFQLLLQIKNTKYRNLLCDGMISSHGLSSEMREKSLPDTRNRVNNVYQLSQCYDLSLNQALSLHQVNLLPAFVFLQLMPQLTAQATLEGKESVRGNLNQDVIIMIMTFLYPLHTTDIIDIQNKMGSSRKRPLALPSVQQCETLTSVGLFSNHRTDPPNNKNTKGDTEKNTFVQA